VFSGNFHPLRTEVSIFERSECCLIRRCKGLNLSLNFSLEDGLQLSSSIVSVSIHWCRDPGVEKLGIISRKRPSTLLVYLTESTW